MNSHMQPYGYQPGPYPYPQLQNQTDERFFPFFPFLPFVGGLAGGLLAGGLIASRPRPYPVYPPYQPYPCNQPYCGPPTQPYYY